MGSVAASNHVVAIAVWVVVGLIALAIVAAVVGRFLVKRGLREPIVVRMINRASDNVIDAVKRPLTVAVLDEVTDVLRTGHYTRNIAAALQENREEIKQMVAEKIKEDPTAGRINLVPFHDRIIEQASETTLRVILEVLADPRTDELISDLLRDNIEQIKQAVRDRQAD
jgi:hypothetical protein